MEIWLQQDNESLRLPVLPSGFEVQNVQQNSTVNVTSKGEINIIGKRGLKALSLSSFFPNREYGFVQYTGFPGPYECIELIKSWMNNPVKISITDANINMPMTIESFTHSEQDSTGDVYYTLELKEYRKPEIVAEQKVNADKKSTKLMANDTKRITKTVKTTTYIVKKGDTLYSIAKRLTGNGSNCYAIANQNNIANPNLIQVGQKLVIKA